METPAVAGRLKASSDLERTSWNVVANLSFPSLILPSEAFVFIMAWGMENMSRAPLNWVAVKELKLSYPDGYILYLIRFPQYSNLN